MHTKLYPGNIAARRCRGSVNEKGYEMGIDEVARPLFDALVEIMKECDDNHSVVAKARAYSIARHAILKATEQL